MKYEYCVMSFRWGKFHEFTCEGETAVASDAGDARDQVAERLRPGLVALQSDRRQAHEDLVAAFQSAQADWESRRSAVEDRFSTEAFEEQSGRFGRQKTTRYRVTMADGGTRSFDDSRGAAAFIAKTVDNQVGDPPSSPSPFEDLSDDELLERLLNGGDDEVVWRWEATMDPEDPTFDSEPFATSARSRRVEELNRLGALGWQIADVSEDRVITTGDSGTSTQVIALVYTLVRETT